MVSVWHCPTSAVIEQATEDEIAGKLVITMRQGQRPAGVHGEGCATIKCPLYMIHFRKLFTWEKKMTKLLLPLPRLGWQWLLLTHHEATQVTVIHFQNFKTEILNSLAKVENAQTDQSIWFGFPSDGFCEQQYFVVNNVIFTKSLIVIAALWTAAHNTPKCVQ